MAEEKERVWHDLEEYTIPEAELHDWLDGDLESRVDVLRRLKPGQYVVVTRKLAVHLDDNIMDTRYFQNYIEALRRRGFDIGKGDAEYGYKMPVPKSGSSSRDLTVFRRKKVS